VVADGAPVAKAVRLGGKEVLSGWVLEKDVPAGAEIAREKWTYTLTEKAESCSAEMDGWKQTGYDWVSTGNAEDVGTRAYAVFPEGFDRDHAIYATYSREDYGAPSGTENGVEWKREVTSTKTAGYVYWHWTWNWSERSGGNYNVFVEDRYCSVNGREYGNFRAFESTEAYGHTDPNGVDGGECFYAWLGDPADGSWWWFRFPVYEQTVEKFLKTYHFERVTTGLESTEEVEPGDGISDVQHWVKYVAD
jgi:hypothetical protein